MLQKTRRIKESPLYQGEDESVAYTLTTTPQGGGPSSPAVVIKDADDSDISGTNMTGSASVDGDVITSPAVHSLTPGAKYRLEFQWVSSGNTLEAWADLYGQE